MSVSIRSTVPEYLARGHRVIEQIQSPYQHIVIAEDPRYGRMLYLDGDLQIAESDEAYNHAMIDPLVERDCLGEVLILGGGDGGVVKAAMEQGAERAVMVDIDEQVVELCQEYLPKMCGDAFKADNAELIIGDAFAYLDGPKKYDAVVYDLTMEPVRAGQGREAFIRETLDKVAAKLKPEGVFSMQCCSEHQLDLQRQIAAALVARFDEVQQKIVDIPSYGERWVFASAAAPR